MLSYRMLSLMIVLVIPATAFAQITPRPTPPMPAPLPTPTPMPIPQPMPQPMPPLGPRDPSITILPAPPAQSGEETTECRKECSERCPYNYPSGGTCPDQCWIWTCEKKQH